MTLHRLAAALACAALAHPVLAAEPLRISFTTDIRSTEPGVNRDSNSDAVVPHIVEGLVAYGEDTEIRPLLAKSVDISPDGRTYTFKLRDGVTFHNGEPLSSADVLWSWNHYMRPDSGWRCVSEFDGRGLSKVESVTAPDPKTVVFQLDKPNGLFLGTLARLDCGGTGILNQASVKADGSWDKPIGTGPFSLAEWRRGEYVSLKRFANYANQDGKRDGYTGSKRPLVDELRFVIVPDDSTAKAALLRGDIDIIEDLSYNDVPVLKKEPSVKVSYAPLMSMTGLLMQTRDPILSNPKLREAIAHAIDYEQLAAAVTEGLAKANNSVVPQASPYYGTVQNQGWKYDPELARQRLAESGYRGQALSILATKRYPQSYNAAVLIQAMLQSVGINAKMETLEWATQLDRYNAGKYQMMTFPYSARLDAALNYEMLTGNKDKQPRKLWDNPKAIERVGQAAQTTDHAERQRLFDELHTLFLADIPSIPIYNGMDVGAVRANVEGYTPWAVKKPRGWEVEKK
ncbi:ABC transporter substrate-binding protein [Bordetella avium]|uniref:ABC transporter substrate-binding protein n=1 Tax=Bordetella avium TaxID=521 RepID=UPI000E68F55F|nr:ABC transporter substrate-binding protein [Bordetella avium]RIQ39533.1 ABC transporter substrate-binding protein [Bordetella avium]RIQ44332.1 ABC transporter substrate-binding protein [Bordetella avium]RIQ45450.1 ABC transporter substrate-binding protein [Bordetella avium]RIQ51371.1 ABC transporter substrate-binding protein [Bordetella avium]RIQ62681.1 ABC transporter substrate-binding protein [Bordetella avium]